MQAAHNQDPACFRTALPVMINSGQICSVDRDNSQLDLAIEYDGARDVLGLPGVNYHGLSSFGFNSSSREKQPGSIQGFDSLQIRQREGAQPTMILCARIRMII
jgi:hypothetical protein